MPCLDDRAAHALAIGALDATAAMAARQHVDTCDDCRGLVALVIKTDDVPAPPEHIGRYQIVSVAGSGAMGIVYEAIDPQLDRRIAIKVLRGDREAELSRERLLREARAVAQVSHPNVISVFDAGIAGGEVFMAMELIRGRTLRGWIAEAPRGWAAIIRVAIEAGRGVHAVHAAGLVHRDIKPDNILVADDGRILVTDFGLVHAELAPERTPTGTLDLTKTGSIVGTPAYLAPEVLDGNDGDPRADQFSFCVALHELLAGRRPFDGPTLMALREAIDRGPPVIERVPAAVASCVARGLAVDPARRWPSIAALTDELARILGRRRRRGWIAAAAAGVAVAAVAGALIVRSLGGASTPSCDHGAAEVARVWTPAVSDRIATAFDGSAVRYAASTWRSTVPAIDGYSKRWAAAYDDACAATHVRHAQSAATLDLRTQCLDRRRGELAAMLDVLSRPDAVQVESAADAIAALVAPEICADAAALAATDPVPDAPALREQVLAIQADLAQVEATARSGHYQDALERVRGVATAAASQGYAPLIAEVESERGRIANDLQAWDEAKTALDTALVAAERGRHARIRGDVHLARAYLAHRRGDPAASLAELELAAAVIDGLGGATVNRARVADYRGQALAALGKLTEAEPALDQAVALYIEAEGETTISLANPLTQLAYVAYQRGDLSTAIAHLTRALDLQVAALGADHPRIGNAHVNLAFNLSAAGRLDDATTHAEAARAIYARAVGEDSEPYAQASRALVGILQQRGKGGEAETIARGVVATIERVQGADSPRLVNPLADLAMAIQSQGRMDEALVLRERALAIVRRTAPAGHPNLVASIIDVADVKADLERCDEAIALYTEARPLADAPEVPPYLAVAARLGLGRCDVELGRHAAAIPTLREALARNAEPENPDDRQLRAQTRFVLAQALWGAGASHRAEAREVAKAAQAEAAELGITPLAEAIAAWIAHPAT